MKRIVDFYLPKMSQEQAFSFFQKVYNLMAEITDANLQPKLKTFLDAIRKFDVALKAVSNGQLAKKILSEDDSRKKAIEHIREQAGAMSANGCEIGGKIEAILDRHDWTPQQTDAEKTVVFDSIISEFERQVVNDDSLELSIADNISLLKRSNMMYKQYVEAHKMEVAGKCVTSETLRTRKEAESIYEDVVAFINAMLVYLGDMEYADLIDRINALIYSSGTHEPEVSQVLYA